MMAILLKFVVIFCLFGHHMSVTLSIRFTPDREHYAVICVICNLPNIYLKYAYEAHTSLQVRSLFLSVQLRRIRTRFFAFTIVQTFKNFVYSIKTGLKPWSGRKKICEA